MSYIGAFSKRDKDNLVYIQETGVQFDGTVGVANSDPILLDATTNFSHDTRAIVSDNPVSDKSDRADHYRVYNPTISFEGVISNDVIGLYEWANNLLDNEARVQQYIQRLKNIHKEKKLVIISLPDGLREENCLITNLTYKRDLKWSNGFYVSIQARQIELLDEDILSEPSSKESNAESSKVDKGDQSTKGSSFNKEPQEFLPAPANTG